MAEEDDIRELIGRMAAAQRQGFHITPGHLRIVMAALRFYLAGRGWVARQRPADPHDDTAQKKAQPYTGPAATIADLKRSGLVAVSITCDGPNCWNTRRVLMDDLGLADATPVPDIARWRGFRCRTCGSRRVRVSPDWRDHRAQGNGRAG